MDKKDVRGVVAIITGSDGYVWATASDFGHSKPAGFTLLEAQRQRADAMAINMFFMNTCSPIVSAALDANYPGSAVFRTVCERAKLKVSYHYVGYADSEL